MNVKKFITIISIFLFILTFSVLQVSADSDGYIVKFKEGYIPTENNFHQISKTCNLYITYTNDFSNEIQNEIEYIEPNEKVPYNNYDYPQKISLFAAPQDDLYSEQWQLKLINADSSWNIETYGNDVRIAVIDSGCSSHDDLNDNILIGKNYFDNSENVTDDIGHGTHVSGIIAAKMNNIGIVGMAPKAKIIPLKCFRRADDQTLNMIIKAIDDAVNVYHCKIINMSWGTTNNNPALKDIIDDAYNKGTILVASVGNQGNSTLYYPAAYDNVIGVGSVNEDKTKSSFSQDNNSVFVVASGYNVKSTYKDGNYKYDTGTSQAAPFVSGLAAISVSINNSLRPSDFMQLLISTSEDLGEPGYDTKYGYGLINTELAINKLLQDKPYYVSPINKDNDIAYVYIKNNSSNILDAVYAFATFDNNFCLETYTQKISLRSGKDTIVNANCTDTSMSCFLWDNFSQMLPLFTKRVYNSVIP